MQDKTPAQAEREITAQTRGKKKRKKSAYAREVQLEIETWNNGWEWDA